MNIAEALERGRQNFPDKPALVFEGEVFTYRRIDEQSNRVANVLAGLGIARGDRVALMLRNSPAFIYAYFGTLKLGAVVVAINTALKAEEVRFMLNDSGARLLVTAAGLLESLGNFGSLPQLAHILTVANGAPGAGTIEKAMARASADSQSAAMADEEMAVILYTSGTTGFPKGAALSHGNVVSNVRACVQRLALTPEDRVLLCLPTFHCFGQNAALNPCFEAGATLLMQSQFVAESALRSIGEQRATVFFGVPTIYGLLHECATPAQLRSVRLFISAAANLPQELAQRWQTKFGTAIHQGYGLTEACLACFNAEPEGRIGSVGAPLPGVELKVVNSEGREAAAGESGEIAIRGPNVMHGYWNRPEATADILRKGWFFTGDIGYADEENHYYIVDRAKDMVNVGGEKVYPSEVENVLAQHPAVAEAAVYGVPEALLGEQVCAAVVLKPGHAEDADNLLAFCRGHLADFKIPDHFEFVGALPKGPTGKVLKRTLQERHEAGQTSHDCAPAARLVSAEAIEDWLVSWIAASREQNPATISTDRPFADYGMTSRLAVAMAQALGAWLGRPIEPVIAWNFPTIATLARRLAQTGEASGGDSADCSAGQTLEFWPAVEGYYVYDALLYGLLANDEQRNRRYQSAIERTVPGKVALEIGPGSMAILSRLCIEAGARKVYAVERGDEACQQARALVERLGLADRIIVIHGEATRVSLPEPADVCVSEIVGSIGGSQGAAVIINQVRHLLKPDGIMIPQRSITRIAAATLPDAALENPFLPPMARHYARKIFDQVGHPFDVRLCLKHFPPDGILSDSAVFEDLDFSRPIPTAYEHAVTLNIRRGGRIDGFLLWLQIHTIEGEVIDILESGGSWLPIYFPVFEPGVAVASGDRIEAICTGQLSDNQLNPDYRVCGRLIRADGSTLAFDHASCHHLARFRHTPFHARLLEPLAETAAEADLASLSDVELLEQLVAEIALAQQGNA